MTGMSDHDDRNAHCEGNGLATDMHNDTGPLIKLESVKKVFYIDEVETHALDNINLEIHKGEYVAIA